MAKQDDRYEAGETPGAPSGCRVISVDDEPIVHGMLKRMIAESGLPVEYAGSASSAREAMEVIPAVRPDICILDIHMEGMDGLTLGESLLEQLDYRPRIIYLTAYDRFEYAQKAIRMGAIEYVLKPLRRAELYEALGRAVNQLQAERLTEMERNRIREELRTALPSVVSDGAPAAESYASGIARRLRKYIDDRCTERITLSGAAEEFRLSPGYLGALFKAGTGHSFKAYLRSVRVAKAKDLMRDPTMNLSEVAQAVGYDDVNYFSDVFLEETGVRPSEYRGSGRRWKK